MASTTTESVGVCTGCEKPIESGAGITVDADGYLWHPDCRAKARPKRSNATIVRNRIRGREIGEAS